MSKPVQRELTCECGRTFSASVYRAVNVTNDPRLRNSILDGSFNVVECPDCHEPLYADIPFLYHDMSAGLAIWVYPENESEREEEIRAKLRRVSEVLASSLGEGLRAGHRPSDGLVFGLEALIRRLAN
jgi:hypothetical protein